MCKNPSDAIAAKYGLEVVSGQDVEPSHFEVKNLKFKTFLKQEDGNQIVGDEMRKRAVQLNGNLGLIDGNYLIDHQDEIPKEARDFFIVLPGTFLHDPKDDNFHIAVLYWDTTRWVLVFDYWREEDWSSHDRFACSE